MHRVRLDLLLQPAVRVQLISHCHRAKSDRTY